MIAHPRRAHLALILGISACSSVPIHYYTLAAKDAYEPQSTPANPALIEVRIAHLPAQLNRPELVVRSGDNELIVLENQRWGSPLRDELRDAIAVRLRSELSESEASRSGPKLEVIVAVDRLEAELNHAVVLSATWSSRATGDCRPTTNSSSLTCSLHAVKSIGPGYAALVDGYQAAISDLSHAIAASLNAHLCQ